MELLIFAGTTEGRQLIETLLRRSALSLVACVATEYGEQLLPSHPRLHIQTGRLNQEEIADCIRLHSFCCVIDATHPYATAVTENIRRACAQTQTDYLRLLRDTTETSHCVCVPSAQEAAAFLNTVDGNVLLTTGSKDLACFTQVNDYAERLYVRVLPTVEALEQCERLGFRGNHRIAMQGPFREALNIALLEQIGAAWLVTKESGTAGGLEEKLRAAQKAGTRVLLLGRPSEPADAGYSMEELLALLERRSLLASPPAPAASYFPLFINLSGQSVLVVGGGAIAARRVQTLLPFGCRITVIAPENTIEPHPQITWHCRPYRAGDCAGADLVLAATDNRAVNHQVFLECGEREIPCNVADCKEECSFFFPAIITEGPVVIGVTASGTDHQLARQTAQKIRENKERLCQISDG